ncbi:hypothetical protein COB55_02155 [Candidatus Wolfebacteria bacterium]|nr:MAG: hypothetical protein COB55_02155 [Candidatus Wolfebacteria bacterium]
MDISSKIEAVLFWKGEPLTIEQLAKIVGSSVTDVENSMKSIEERFSGGGISLVRVRDMVELRTSSDSSALIEELSQAEMKKDLGKAGLETLSIILYQGPVSRAEIDYIRGVNSNFILRNLSIRGLVERIANPDDKRSFLYQPTLELLGHLGVSKVEDLPEFTDVKHELENFSSANTDEEDIDNKSV